MLLLIGIINKFILNLFNHRIMKQAIDGVYWFKFKTYWFKTSCFKIYFLLKENEQMTISLDFIYQYYKISFKIFFILPNH